MKNHKRQLTHISAYNQLLKLSLNMAISIIIIQSYTMKKLQLTFNKKYLASTRIGLGTNSEIYMGYELTSQAEIAIKVDPITHKDSTLQRQAKFYRVLKGGVGFPNLHWYGVQHNYRALVTDNYGPSLQHLLKYCKGSFTLKTVLLVADQILQRIEWVHFKGLIYNDIQPSNFLVGLGQKQDKIFLVDFGSCEKYLDQEGRHIALQTERQPKKSNIKFRSTNAHIGKKKGRRDDLQSIGYLLVYFLRGGLPWDDLNAEHQNYELWVKERKVSVPASLLCEGLPDQFSKYFEYVRTLEFEQQPDYGWLRRSFKDLFESSGLVNNRVLDWAQRHKY